MEYYQNFMEKYGDPRVKNWALMESPLLPLFITLLYILAVVYILPAYMRTRDPYDLTKIIRWYNIFQVISCGALMYKIATAGYITGEYSFTCQPVDYTDDPKATTLANMIYWSYILKLIDLVDTVFFILRKKFRQVSVLHVYHHASTFLFTYIITKFMAGGMLAFHLMVNCLIHVVMYSYYYLSSLGPDWQKTLAPWKPKITTAQMVQFTILIIQGLAHLQPGCKFPKVFTIVWTANVAVNYVLFFNFYRKTYINNKSKPS